MCQNLLVNRSPYGPCNVWVIVEHPPFLNSNLRKQICGYLVFFFLTFVISIGCHERIGPLNNFFIVSKYLILMASKLSKAT